MAITRLEPSDDTPERVAQRQRDAAAVRRALDGDQQAFGRLYDEWFDRVFHLVRRIVRDQDMAMDVSQDAFLAAWRNLANLDDPASFGGWLLRIARNKALNAVARARPETTVDDDGLARLERDGPARPAPGAAMTPVGAAADPAQAAVDGDLAALVQETVGALAARDAEVLDLQLRYHLSPAEIGEVIGVNRNAANQLCHRVRGRFASAFGLRQLWTGRRPSCPVLASELETAGVDGFGPDALAIAGRHIDRCPDCAERRDTNLRPLALFAALPLVPVMEALRADAAAALHAAGVPMQGSQALGGAAIGGPTPAPASSPSGDRGDPPDPGGPDAPGEADAGPGQGPAVPTAEGATTTAALSTAAMVVAAGTTGPDAPVGSTGPAVAVSGAVPGRPGADPTIRRLHRRRWVLAGVIAVVVVLLAVAGWHQLRPTGPGELRVASDVGQSSTTAPPSTATTGAPSTAPGTLGVVPSAPAPPDPSAPPATAPPVTAPAPRPTDPPPPTTQPLGPAPVVDRFAVDPGGPFPSPYWMNEAPPVLAWSVTGASSVEVSWWFDPGDGSGPRRAGVVSTEPVGSLALCHVAVDANQRCFADRGEYTYRIDAVGPDGQRTVTPPAAAPGYRVVVT